jgi:rhamnogalacturonyl hydrolase YesR
VPKSPYIAIVYRYADALVKGNLDSHQLEQNDLRILYTLSELSNKPAYRDAADKQLKLLLQNPERMKGPRLWMLWDRCFEIAPDAARAAVDKVESIRGFAVAYEHTKDKAYLKRLDASVDRSISPIELWGAASRVPEPLASELRQFAERQDKSYLGAVKAGNLNAGFAMLCVSRYENCGNVEYRKMIRLAADGYKSATPDGETLPMTFGHLISLELAAWRHESKAEYLDAARNLADIAVKRFWNGNDPLPTMTTGADTLVLSLLELHLSVLHITAVRCPPNTIDR